MTPDSPMDVVRGWFSQRGWTPFEFQEDTWLAYLNKESGLVHAPTGMGKTYAVWMGPLLEWLAEGGNSLAITPLATSLARSPLTIRRGDRVGLRVLWITPLRALVNDTEAALNAPLAAMGLPWRVESRTGDTSSHIRQRQRKSLPSALITTPENLSLLLSYPETRENFRDLRTVIVDEWHEQIGTKRGIQTELALARLKQWSPELRVWGLSATLGNLTEAMSVLVGANGRGRLVQGLSPKDVRVECLLPATVEKFPWAGHLGTRLLPEVVHAIDLAKSTLLFTNTRSQAELWYRALLQARPDWAGALALHHGSIDRKLRRQAETLLHAGRLRCVVATSSLDLGVDFSPVDQVLQVGGPKGVARLLQRAGRSGHQPGATSRVLGVPTHAFELIEFAAARTALLEGRIEARRPLERPLDVLSQHVVTLALSEGVDADALFEEVRTTYAFRDLSREEWGWVMDFVSFGGKALRAYPQHARVALREGRWRVTSPAVARMHRMSIGTITSDGMMQVKLGRGRVLGSVEESFITRMQPGSRFLFAGRLLELLHVRDMAAHVRLAKGASGIVPQWMGGRMPLSTELAAAVRRKLQEAHEGIYNDPEMVCVQPLLQLQKRWSLIPSADELLIEFTRSREGVHAFIYPFQGRLVHEGLASLVAYRMSRRAPRTLSLSFNDYGFCMTTPQALDYGEDDWKAFLSGENLLEDLLACLNSTELMRRRFRDIARVAGLVFQGYPGKNKSTRQIQVSSGLFFDVFSKYDPDNMLLTQARREVLESQLEYVRLRDTLTLLAGQRIRLVPMRRLSPFSFPLWADRLQGLTVSSENWADRVRRMAESLERAAEEQAFTL